MPINNQFLQRDYFLGSAHSSPVPAAAAARFGSLAHRFGNGVASLAGSDFNLLSGRATVAEDARGAARDASPPSSPHSSRSGSRTRAASPRARGLSDAAPADVFDAQILDNAAREYYWGVELLRLYQDYHTRMGQLGTRGDDYSPQLLAYFAFFHRLDAVVLLPELTPELGGALRDVHQKMLGYLAANPLVVKTLNVLLNPSAKRFRKNHMLALAANSKMSFNTTNSLLFVNTRQGLQLLCATEDGVKGVIINTHNLVGPITIAEQAILDDLSEVKQLFTANGICFGAKDNEIYTVTDASTLAEEAHITRQAEHFYTPTANFIAQIHDCTLTIYSASRQKTVVAEHTLQHPIKHVSQSPVNGDKIRFAITLLTNEVEIHTLDTRERRFSADIIPVSHYMTEPPLVDATFWRTFDKFEIVDATEPANKKIYRITFDGDKPQIPSFPTCGSLGEVFTQYTILPGAARLTRNEIIECLGIQGRRIRISKEGLPHGRDDVALTKWETKKITEIEGDFSEAVLSPDGRCLALRLKNNKIALVDLFGRTETLYVPTAETTEAGAATAE
jgi:hypothetical protein